MGSFWGHLHTINHHRRLVRQGCFRMGLYWQGLTHDLSKYAPVEFLTGVRYYQGTRSPNTAEREEKGWERSVDAPQGKEPAPLGILDGP